MVDIKKSFKQINKIIKNMAKEKDEIRKLLNEVDSTLRQHDEGEEHLKTAREYYIEAMEKLEDAHKNWGA